MASGTRRVGLKSFQPLLLSDEGDDRIDIGLVEALHRWHRPEIPVMLRGAGEDGNVECPITMMAGHIYLGEMGWPPIGAPEVGTMTLRAVGGVELGACSNEFRILRIDLGLDAP